MERQLFMHHHGRSVGIECTSALQSLHDGMRRVLQLPPDSCFWAGNAGGKGNWTSLRCLAVCVVAAPHTVMNNKLHCMLLRKLCRAPVQASDCETSACFSAWHINARVWPAGLAWLITTH